MIRPPIAIAWVLIIALSACSSPRPTGSGALQPALSTASSGLGPSGAGPSGATAPPAGPTQTGTHKPGTHTSGTHAPKPVGSSAPAQPADFGFSWSNAECQWFITSNGSADVRMTGNVAASAPNTGMIVLTVTSNGGGVSGATQYYPPAHLKTGDNRYVAEITAPPANLERHTITFKGTLAFNGGQSDNLDADNAASLAVTFPATFQAATGETYENLGCSHVPN